MNNARYLPISLKVNNEKCLVVGGGKVAFRKISVLLKFGAAVTCMSPEFAGPLERLKDLKKIKCARMRYPGSMNLKGYALVMAATDDGAVNKRVARDAKRAGVPVNVVDASVPGTFIMPAIVKTKGLIIGISTGGKSPKRAKRIKEILENAL